MQIKLEDMLYRVKYELDRGEQEFICGMDSAADKNNSGKKRSGTCCGDQELFFTLRYELATNRGPNSVASRPATKMNPCCSAGTDSSMGR